MSTDPRRPLAGTTLGLHHDLHGYQSPMVPVDAVLVAPGFPRARLMRTIAETLRCLGEACDGVRLVSLHLDLSTGEPAWVATHETACCNGAAPTAYEAMYRLAHLLAVQMPSHRARLTAFADSLEGL